MKKTILIPTDFSENARNAIRYALNLFGDGNHFILLNTWQTPYTPPEVLISVEDILMNASKEGLAKEIEWVKSISSNGKNTYETISEFGILVEILKTVVRERNIDFVVMGTQGARGLQEVLLGSNTAAAAKSLNCPLLAIPSNAKFNGLKRIVFSADYKQIENSASLNTMIDLAEENNAEVTVLNILDKGKITDVNQGYEGMKIDHELAGLKHSYSFIEDDDKAAGIDEFLRTNDTSLLVMLERKTGFFKSIFHKSITKQLAFHSHVPMLVLHS